MSYRKKLIEVALPLDTISKASSEEKMIHTGLPSNLHSWWSRKPLAASRAVLFAQIVDDPSSWPEDFPTLEAQEAERSRLFSVIENLIKHEAMTNNSILHMAKVEIARSTARAQGIYLPQNLTSDQVTDALQRYAPSMLDPFGGGGSIPLEGQRLGLQANASDLNPVAVLINKALIELPPLIVGHPPVNPEASKALAEGKWQGIQGLAHDVRYYGQWMRDEAQQHVGHLYPKIALPKEYGGGEAEVIAWLWARTVTCSNPACRAQMPLVNKFWVSTHKGNEAWVEPIVDRETGTIQFTIRTGAGNPLAGTVNQSGATCLACGASALLDYIRVEGQADRMGYQMMAIVVDGPKGRIYLPPDNFHVKIAADAHPSWVPDTDMPAQALGFRVQRYGIIKHRHLFTSRQLDVLSTFSDLIPQVYEQILDRSGGDVLYAKAVVTFLALSISRLAQTNNALVRWLVRKTGTSKGTPAFDRPIVSMLWEFSEGNVFGKSVGSWHLALENPLSAFKAIPTEAVPGTSIQRDAASEFTLEMMPIISTDPPYFDNIGYADLSDFSYIWLRKALRDLYPDLFKTILVPKRQELIAAAHLFNGDRIQAEKHFLDGLRKSFSILHKIANPDYPMTVYYAFKQTESDIEDPSTNTSLISSTGWETMLEAILEAGFIISETWPMRTEQINRLRAIGSNALASSIVLVCRPRPQNAPIATRRQFIKELEVGLAEALKKMQHGSIAPVDLAQASIGPGMEIYSKYSKVIDANGDPIRVKTALQFINHALDKMLTEQDGELDLETRWAVAWFETFGMEEAKYGDAETLSKAKNVATQSLVEAGIIETKAGKVRLLKPEDYPDHERWYPTSSARLTAWEVMQRAIHGLDKHGEDGAARVLGSAGDLSFVVRDLAYRMYAICERKAWTQEALSYNMLIASWSGISDQVRKLAAVLQQTTLNL
jgi:putative DNA methylase